MSLESVSARAERRWGARWCWLAGVGEATTGVLLIVVPAVVLGLLDIPPPWPEPAYVGLLGVFVGCVGLCYLYPFLAAPGPARRVRIATVLELTAGFRLAVALFIGVSVARSALAVQWLTVGTADAMIALVQLALLQVEDSGWMG